MQTLLLAGWREGLQALALTNLQRKLLHLSLKEAKENVDRLLEAEEGVLPNNPVLLQIPDEVASEFSSRADELGVLIGFVSFSAVQTPVQRTSTTSKINSQQAA